MNVKVEKKIDDKWVECGPSEIKKGDTFRTYEDNELDQWSQSTTPDYGMVARSDAYIRPKQYDVNAVMWGILTEPEPTEIYIKVKKTTSEPHWRYTHVKCLTCDKIIEDKELIIVANVGQVFKAMVNTGNNWGDNITVGHVRKTACHFHKECFFENVCKNDALKKLVEKSELTDEDWKYMEKLAGL